MKEDHESTEKSILTTAPRYTEKQGQYLAFIYYYTKINQYPPAEIDMQRFFEVSAPSVHRMLIDLEKKEMIAKIPTQARRVRVLLPLRQLPDLL